MDIIDTILQQERRNCEDLRIKIESCRNEKAVLNKTIRELENRLPPSSPDPGTNLQATSRRYVIHITIIKELKKENERLKTEDRKLENHFKSSKKPNDIQDKLKKLKKGQAEMLKLIKQGSIQIVTTPS